MIASADGGAVIDMGMSVAAWREVLAGVRLVVVHDDCMDGLASAMIIREVLPDVPIMFVQYNSPAQRDLPVEPGMLFCDVTPDAARIDEYVEAGTVVLDHHKHARALVARFGARGIFADEASDRGMSGALLAYHFVWRMLEAQAKLGKRTDLVERFATLAGVRDTWWKDHPEWQLSLVLHAVLEHFPREFWMQRLDGATFDGIGIAIDELPLGKILVDAKAATVARLAAERVIVERTTQGVWALCSVGRKYVSDLADFLREQAELAVNVFVSVHLTVEAGEMKVTCSLRSDGTIDVGALAVEMGGGGHSRAAGFIRPYINPRLLFEHLMGRALGLEGSLRRLVEQPPPAAAEAAR
jgi:oligoribonuclease NrnB/cAMP/cGMP phosphodiesterase (DHH superfamily)